MNLHDRDIRKEALEEGRVLGLSQGLSQGISQKATEAARNLLSMNLLTPEQIAQATGLTLEEVLEIKKELENPVRV